VPEVMQAILEKYPQVCFLTVGDEVCKVLEIELKHERIINRSGEWSIRQSCLACRHADLVIAPDTGLLHASGCWSVPKIGLLNHTSLKNITKHFENDYSLDCSGNTHSFFGPVSCSPCYAIHSNKRVTCNTMEIKHTKVPICMATLTADKVISRIEEVMYALKVR